MRSPAGRCFATAGIVATGALALAMGALALGTVPAAACDHPCGYGYGASYYAPPAYAYAPVAVYAAPPVYSYSYYGPSYPPLYYHSYYTTRVNIFRGPRWNYSAAYYTSPVVHRVGCHVSVSPCAHRVYFRPYRSFYYGPIYHGWRRW